jgi:hypothetical protein
MKIRIEIPMEISKDFLEFFDSSWDKKCKWEASIS